MYSKVQDNFKKSQSVIIQKIYDPNKIIEDTKDGAGTKACIHDHSIIKKCSKVSNFMN